MAQGNKPRGRVKQGCRFILFASFSNRAAVVSSMPNNSPHLTRVPDTDAAAAAAGEYIIHQAKRAVSCRGRFTLALSGGKTPLALFRLFAQPGWRCRMPWDKTLVAWVDERCVPADNPESNYGEALRAGLPLDLAACVLPMVPAIDPIDPELAATAYEQSIRKAFAAAPGTMPVFDAVLLGMGEDGHVASLFPNSSGLSVTDKLVVAQYPADKTPRLTLTLPVLNATRACLLLVTGIAKHAALQRLLHREDDATHVPKLPVQHIHPHAGEFHLLVDDSAFWGVSHRQ